MIWLQGVNMFGTVPSYSGERSTSLKGIRRVKEEGTVAEGKCIHPVIRKTREQLKGKGKDEEEEDKLTFPGVSYSPL